MRRRFLLVSALIAAYVLHRWLQREESGSRGVAVPRAHPHQPLMIHCELCGIKIPSARYLAWVTAIDHALDHHRAKLLAEPENARRYFRIVNPETGKQARLPQSSPQEPAPS